MRAGAADNDLLDRLAGDDRLGLTAADLTGLLAAPIDFVGTALHQVAAFVERVDHLVEANPEAASYSPGTIL